MIEILKGFLMTIIFFLALMGLCYIAALFAFVIIANGGHLTI